MDTPDIFLYKWKWHWKFTSSNWFTALPKTHVSFAGKCLQVPEACMSGTRNRVPEKRVSGTRFRVLEVRTSGNPKFGRVRVPEITRPNFGLPEVCTSGTRFRVPDIHTSGTCRYLPANETRICDIVVNQLKLVNFKRHFYLYRNMLGESMGSLPEMLVSCILQF